MSASLSPWNNNIEDFSSAIAGIIIILFLILSGLMSCGPAPIVGLKGYTLIENGKAVSPTGDTVTLTSTQKLEYSVHFKNPGDKL